MKSRRAKLLNAETMLPIVQFKAIGRQKGPPTKAEDAADRERVSNLRGAVGPDFTAQCNAEMKRAADRVTGVNIA